MNILNLFNEIEKADPEIYERVNDRRDAIKHFGSFSSKVILASLPFAFGSVFKKAYGQTTPSSVLDVLNYALTLEYLEAEFYSTAVASQGLIPGSDNAGIVTIRDHENAHVVFLKTAIESAGGTPVSKPEFDFTAGGMYGNVFSNYDSFLAVAQAFEDTGVRAYKGQAANLMSNKDVLTAALNIHSVEARHAAHIRRIRGAGGAAVKPWITGKETGGIPSVQTVYNGEEITTQATIEITGINGFSISGNAASESFDEPLEKEDVLAIIKPFIK